MSGECKNRDGSTDNIESFIARKDQSKGFTNENTVSCCYYHLTGEDKEIADELLDAVGPHAKDDDKLGAYKRICGVDER